MSRNRLLLSLGLFACVLSLLSLLIGVSALEQTNQGVSDKEKEANYYLTVLVIFVAVTLMVGFDGLSSLLCFLTLCFYQQPWIMFSFASLTVIYSIIKTKHGFSIILFNTGTVNQL